MATGQQSTPYQETKGQNKDVHKEEYDDDHCDDAEEKAGKKIHLIPISCSSVRSLACWFVRLHVLLLCSLPFIYKNLKYYN